LQITFRPSAKEIRSDWDRRMDERVEAVVDNDRSIMLLTNNDDMAQPLIILVPQWSKATFETLSKKRQEEIVSEFAHEIGEAWERFLKEG